MKLFLKSPRPTGLHSERAFTMVEIVLSLAIIAVALVAIIGVLPIGLNVQTENQEESVVTADATIWMEAIRNGARGLEYLVQDDAGGNDFYIEEVMVETMGRTRTVDRQLFYEDETNSVQRTYYRNFNGASNLVALLSLPKYPQNYWSLSVGETYTSYNVYADVRALNGNMADLASDLDFAFKYRLTPELVPLQAVHPLHQFVVRTNQPIPIWAIQTNLFELRLSFQWPLIVGAGGDYRNQTNFQRRLTFRTQISGQPEPQPLDAANFQASGAPLLYGATMAGRRYSYLTNTVNP